MGKVIERGSVKPDHPMFSKPFYVGAAIVRVNSDRIRRRRTDGKTLEGKSDRQNLKRDDPGSGRRRE